MGGDGVAGVASAGLDFNDEARFCGGFATWVFDMKVASSEGASSESLALFVSWIFSAKNFVRSVTNVANDGASTCN